MGTNYYLITKNSDIAHKYFANNDMYGTWDEEYVLRDIPDFHYEMHLNKLSYGWRPLFQIHKVFRSFTELENFYKEHKSDLTINDEYDNEYTWDEYKEKIFSHINGEPTPMKWYYKEDPVFGKPGQKYLMTEECDPEEAELWIPFSHTEYSETEHKAQIKYGITDQFWNWRDRYKEDPDYMIDWVEGEFS